MSLHVNSYKARPRVIGSNFVSVIYDNEAAVLKADPKVSTQFATHPPPSSDLYSVEVIQNRQSLL